jgi:DNA helicase-2/ATP-dependent DNA helicase PcrA
MDLLSDLNPQQRDAVTFGEGPLLIVAGVGTGKTTVITRRIAWLIAEKKALPADILALTFTEKAAAEMEERVDVLVPYGYIEAQIGTFHAFCDRVLRENAVLLGLSPDYRILTEAEQAIFLKDHLFDLLIDSARWGIRCATFVHSSPSSPAPRTRTSPRRSTERTPTGSPREQRAPTRRRTRDGS